MRAAKIERRRVQVQDSIFRQESQAMVMYRGGKFKKDRGFKPRKMLNRD